MVAVRNDDDRGGLLIGGIRRCLGFAQRARSRLQTKTGDSAAQIIGCVNETSQCRINRNCNRQAVGRVELATGRAHHDRGGAGGQINIVA